MQQAVSTGVIGYYLEYLCSPMDTLFFLSDLFLLKKEQIVCFGLWCYFNFVLQYIQYKFLKCSTASVLFILKTVLNMQQLGYGEFLNNITIPKSVFK